MVADRLAEAVREQVRLGRVLPLGQAADRAWVTERCAVGALRAAAAGLGGSRLGTIRIGPAEGSRGAVAVSPAEPSTARVGPVRAQAGAPPGAVPYGPLRVEAGFEAGADRPLPVTADQLRRKLWDAAHEGLGLPVSAVDLEITGLLGDTPDAPPTAGRGAGEPPRGAADRRSPEAEAVVGAVEAVPGVARITARLGGFGPGVRVAERHVQVQIAVAQGHRALDVARAVASAATGAVTGPATVAVVVTDTA